MEMGYKEALKACVQSVFEFMFLKCSWMSVMSLGKQFHAAIHHYYYYY